MSRSILRYIIKIKLLITISNVNYLKHVTNKLLIRILFLKVIVNVLINKTYYKSV